MPDTPQAEASTQAEAMPQATSQAEAVPSTEIVGLCTGIGPGRRGSTCNICMEKIGSTDESATHMKCSNTFHEHCFEGWIESNDNQFQPTTCPLCREIMPDMNPPEAMGIHIDRIAPPWSAGSNAPPMTTTEEEMYDYDMREIVGGGTFPSPALMHRLLHGDDDDAMNWMIDYVRRHRVAFLLSRERTILRLRAYFVLLAEADTGTDDPAFLAELGPDEVATDLELINTRTGARRVRPSVVTRYRIDWERASRELQERMRFAQRYLRLDVGRMRQLQQAFEARVALDVERAEAEQTLASGGETVRSSQSYLPCILLSTSPSRKEVYPLCKATGQLGG